MPIQVPPDSTGKIVRTKTDSGTQEQQTITIGNGSDITNVAVLSDMDTGVGTELSLNVSLRKSASGGSTEYGTATSPIRVDPVGTTVQPVSGTFWQATQPVSGNVSSVTATAGGCSIYHTLAAASNNAASIKGSVGQVYGWYIYNNSGAYPIFVKLYNKASAPTVGTDTPVQTIAVSSGVPVMLSLDNGVAYSLGIGISITLGIADLDNTAVAANDCVVDIFYK